MDPTIKTCAMLLLSSDLPTTGTKRYQEIWRNLHKLKLSVTSKDFQIRRHHSRDITTRETSDQTGGGSQLVEAEGVLGGWVSYDIWVGQHLKLLQFKWVQSNLKGFID